MAETQADQQTALFGHLLPSLSQQFGAKSRRRRGASQPVPGQQTAPYQRGSCENEVKAGGRCRGCSEPPCETRPPARRQPERPSHGHRIHPLFESVATSRRVGAAVQSELAMARREGAGQHEGAPFPESGDLRAPHSRNGSEALHPDLDGGRKERRSQDRNSDRLRQADPRRGLSPTRGRRSSKDTQRDPNTTLRRVPPEISRHLQAPQGTGRRGKSN